MSHHPLAHKLAVVKTLYGRAEGICSDVTAKDQETRHIRQALINNGYPKGVLQHHTTPAPTDLQTTIHGVQWSPSHMCVVCPKQCGEF